MSKTLGNAKYFKRMIMKIKGKWRIIGIMIMIYIIKKILLIMRIIRILI
jgi:hypothetical protein